MPSQGVQNTAQGMETCGLQWAMGTDLLSWAQMWLFPKLVLNRAAEKHFHIKAKMKEECVPMILCQIHFCPFWPLWGLKVLRWISAYRALVFVRISEIRWKGSCIVDQKAHNNCDLGYCHDTTLSLKEAGRAMSKLCECYCHHYFFFNYFFFYFLLVTLISKGQISDMTS